MEFGIAFSLELLAVALALVFCVRPERTRPVFSWLLLVAFLVSFVVLIWAAKIGL
jgi:hypothetical protein